MQNLNAAIKKIINQEVKSKVGRTVQGLVVDYNSSSKEVTVVIEGQTTTAYVMGSYKPAIHDKVIVETVNNKRFASPSYNTSLEQRESDSISSIMQNEFYQVFGNHIRMYGNQFNTSYSSSLTSFSISTGEANIEGQIFTLTSTLTFIYDLNTLSEGTYYLVLNVTGEVSIITDKLSNQLPLLKITKITDSFIIEDNRPLLKL